LLLAEVIRQKQLECCVPFLWVFGEQLTEAGARTIEQAFHGKLYRDYGAGETAFIGAECPCQQGYHLDLTRHWVEVLSGEQPAQPGEMGEVVITHFRNSAAPIVRYRIGDLGALSDPLERCPCGNTFPRLLEILGRVREVVHTPSGQRISEFFFGHLADLLNSAHEHFVQYRVIQRELDLLEILWVPRHERAHEFLPELEAKLVERAGTAIRIQWQAVETIPADRSGKRLRFVPLGRVQAGQID
jgi:phenylacetate-CoA ligase